MTSIRIGDPLSVAALGVIVTGGAGGIGRGFAAALAANGARVALPDASPPGSTGRSQ